MTTIKTNQALIAAALFGGTALLMMPAMSDPAFAATDAGANTLAIAPPSVLTFDQKLDGKTVTIKYANLPNKGYLVIYGSDAEGKPAKEPLGYVALSAGDHRDIKVELTKVPAKNSRLWTSLYNEKNGNSKLEKGTDVSYWAGRPLSTGGEFRIE